MRSDTRESAVKLIMVTFNMSLSFAQNEIADFHLQEMKKITCVPKINYEISEKHPVIGRISFDYLKPDRVVEHETKWELIFKSKI